MDIRIPDTLDAWNAAGTDYLPGLLGMRFSKVVSDEVVATLEVRRPLGAWNGYLHAGTVTSLALTPAAATARCAACLRTPSGSLPWSLIGTAREGTVTCAARPIHKGRTAQVWDAEVRRESDGAAIAYFRNTQLIL